MPSGYGLVVVRESSADTRESLTRLARTTGPGGMHAVVVDGEQCRDQAALFEALARGLAFPSYFGRNWDAVQECLADLLALTDGGLGSAFGDRAGIDARTLVLAFVHSGRLLDTGEDLVAKLVESFGHAVESNRERTSAGLRVIFQLDETEPAETEQSLRRLAG